MELNVRMLSAAGALLLLLLGIMTGIMIDVRQSVSEVLGALPHIQARVDRIDQRYERLEPRLRALEQAVGGARDNP